MSMSDLTTLALLLTIAAVTTCNRLPVKIINHPKSQIASQGDQVTFTCDYTLLKSPPSPAGIYTTWLFNLRPIANHHSDIITDQNKLTISSYKPRVNSGEYRCLINNTLFNPPFVILSEAATLTRAFINNFEPTQPQKIHLSIGNVAIIPCQLPVSNPPAIPIFYHNDKEVSNTDRTRIFPTSGNLQINNVNNLDSGSYSCAAMNPLTGETKRQLTSTDLKVFEPFGTKLPEISFVPVDTNRVKIGANLTLECVANGAPVPLVSWEKFGGTLPLTRSKQVFGNLVLTDVQPQDKGTYVCRAETGPGQATFKTAMVDVFAAPSVTDKNQVTFGKDGETVELICPIEARPRADITWLYQGKQVTNLAQRISGDKSILIIENFQTTKSTGIYQCHARNDYGTVQADLLLIPNVEKKSEDEVNSALAPTILMGPQDTTIYEGQTVVLMCITNSPQSTTQINWLQNELIIEPTLMRRFEINQLVGNLRIVSVQKSDAGIYKCIASNEYGMATAQATVKVVNNGEVILNEQPIVGVTKPTVAKSVASRPSIKQIGGDKILLNWQLIHAKTGLLETNAQVLNNLAYFKVEYKTRARALRNGQPPANVWLTIDEQIDPNKREYILTDLAKFETYRFRIGTFYLNGEFTHSHASLRFRLEKTWTPQPITSTPKQGANLPLSALQVTITQVWAIASSSLGIRWSMTKTNTNSTSLTNSKGNLNGFYIYYRRISAEHISTDTDGQVKINTASIPGIPIVNYTRIKVPVQGAPIDSYMIDNLAKSSVYEIKMSCYNLIGDLCAFSNTLYGITLQEKTEYQEEAPANESVSIVSTDTSGHEALFIALGTVLAVLTLVLGVFIVMCIVRHRQHKKLLAQLNDTSQKMSSSSCPTLIYEDSLRQNCQQRSNYVKHLNFGNSTQDSGSTNSQSMSTTASMITPPGGSEPLNGHLLLMNGNTISCPPVPQLPPPQIYNGMNINLNPMNMPMSPNTQKINVQNNAQENFYHTLTALGNLPAAPQQSQQVEDQNFYSDYSNAALNFHAQILMKQQQQQFFINTLKHMQQQQQKSPQSPGGGGMHSMRRNNSCTGSKKSKKSLRRSENQENQTTVQEMGNNNYYLLPQQQQRGQNQQFSEMSLLEAALLNQNTLNLLNPYLVNGFLSGGGVTEQKSVQVEPPIEEQEKEPLNQ